jgi:hypothetical protein
LRVLLRQDKKRWPNQLGQRNHMEQVARYKAQLLAGGNPILQLRPDLPARPPIQ